MLKIAKIAAATLAGGALVAGSGMAFAQAVPTHVHELKAENVATSTSAPSQTPIDTDALTPGIEVIDSDTTPDGDLVDEKPTTIIRTEVVDNTHLRVFYQQGTDRCFGAYPVAEMINGQIHLTMFTGRMARAPQACTLELLTKSMVVELHGSVQQHAVVLHAPNEPVVDPTPVDSAQAEK